MKDFHWLPCALVVAAIITNFYLDHKNNKALESKMFAAEFRIQTLEDAAAPKTIVGEEPAKKADKKPVVKHHRPVTCHICAAPRPYPMFR